MSGLFGRLTRVQEPVLVVVGLVIIGAGCAGNGESETLSEGIVRPQGDESTVAAATVRPAGEPPAAIGEVSSPRRARTLSVFSEIHFFHSFPVMVATSDLVIVGIMSATIYGRAVSPPVSELQIGRFEVDVQEVLFGSLDLSRIILEMNQPYASLLNNTSWSRPGDRSVLFLERNNEMGARTDLPDIYRLTNSQSLYRAPGQDRLEGDAFVQGVAAWSLSELRAQIESAKGKIESGEVLSQLHGAPSREQNTK